jgi:periplasmic protein TonB
MTTAPESYGLRRWIFSAILVLSAHAGVAAAMVQWSDPEEDTDVSGAIVIELAPLPVAAADRPEDMIPGPDQVDAEMQPQKQIEQPVEKQVEEKIEQVPDAEVTLALQEPEPKPQPPDPIETMPAPFTSALPSPMVPELAAVPAAPVIATPQSSVSNSLPLWKNAIADQLERFKRYPSEARNRHQQGAVQLGFVIDREGRVLGSRVVTSSGSSALDKEAVDMAMRASPFPAPPPELRGDKISLTVPIRFNIK